MQFVCFELFFLSNELLIGFSVFFTNFLWLKVFQGFQWLKVFLVAFQG